MELTKEQRRVYEKNKRTARQYFMDKGMWFDGAVMHHEDPLLRHDDIERYIQWNIEDLTVMSKGAHIKLHWEIDHDERCQKMSRSATGHLWRGGGYPKGKPKSEEVKQNMRVPKKTSLFIRTLEAKPELKDRDYVEKLFNENRRFVAKLARELNVSPGMTRKLLAYHNIETGEHIK